MVLLDCTYMAYRAFHTQALKDIGGNWVIAGFLAEMLTVFQMEYKTPQIGRTQLVFCWDSRKSFRKLIYPEYKAHRKDGLTENELAERQQLYDQIEDLRTTILPGMGFNNVLCQPGLEADDLIAKIIQQEKHKPITIISADKDLYQCLASNVIWKDPWRKKSMTASLLFDQTGLDPARYGFMKAFVGCESDNIEGIPGIGEITAVAWLIGRLAEGKKKQTIEDPQYDDLIKRNQELVTLPHPKTRGIELKQDDVTIQKIRNILRTYNLLGLLRSRLSDWQRLCVYIQGAE